MNNKIEKQLEQKKEYTSPKMEVVEYTHEATLLSASGDNNINVFSTESLEDEYETVLFRSRIEVRGQMLPMVIIIDKSVFTIIRTQIVTGIEDAQADKLKTYLNDLNREFKIFKYYLREDGNVYLDICLPFVDESFDSQMVQLMLSILVKHLEAVYGDVMAFVWAKDDKAEKKKK